MLLIYLSLLLTYCVIYIQVYKLYRYPQKWGGGGINALAIYKLSLETILRFNKLWSFIQCCGCVGMCFIIYAEHITFPSCLNSSEN